MGVESVELRVESWVIFRAVRRAAFFLIPPTPPLTRGSFS